MENQLIECVPNFSEGRNSDIIERIASEIKSIDGVKLLNVDPGKATNRTVMTFVGEPNAVIEAAYKAIKKASELIDMSKHSGEHPRMGATDVCPLIPIANITMKETVKYAKKLGERVGRELNIPVFLYEAAASNSERKNLAVIREGEYEGLEKKLERTEWKPDFGDPKFNVRSGATVIGARDFLIAYNINLNTKSTRIANAIAFDVREQGRVKRIGHPLLGEIEKDESGNAVRIPGTLKSVKAIGWFIEEYNIAQISMNLTDVNSTPVHLAFDEVSNRAMERGIRVTGSEIVGMVPKKVLTDAGQYFLQKQKRSIGVSEEEVIQIAIKSLGLEDISQFKPEERIIEYMLESGDEFPLNNLSLRNFANATASESAAPGGGSISAYVGALGSSLFTMVANLSANKRGWEDKIDYFSEIAKQGQNLKDELLMLVDKDTKAFDKVMQAFAMPKETDEDKKKRKSSIDEANTNAARIPLQVMETANMAFPLIREMVEKGNANSITDATVGALCTRTAIEGAYLNIRVNVSGLPDGSDKEDILQSAEKILSEARKSEKEILEYAMGKIK
jgi:glutamate formiminotransferase/formiminotetrahydrofolate cyclodeaminase